MGIIKPEDRKFVLAKGDPGFSPERNKKIIASVMKKHEAMRKKKMDQFVDKLRERTDAVAWYLKSRTAESNLPIEKYLGKTELARLRGQRIMEEVQGRMRKLSEV
jgi:hypothetical protein